MEELPRTGVPLGQVMPSLLFLAFHVLYKKTTTGDMGKLVSRFPGLEACYQKLHAFEYLVACVETRTTQANGVIFGGYVRDTIALVVPHDIDIRFRHEEDLQHFITTLLPDFDVYFVGRNSHTYQSIFSRGRGRRALLIRLRVVHREHPDLFIQLDLTLEHDWRNVRPDFDGNTYLLRDGIRRTDLVSSGHDKDVLELRLKAMLLCVIDARGVPNAYHDTPCQCILRTTRDGQKLLLRIRHMEKKGWTIEGKGECMNPLCVLASEQLVISFVATMMRDLDSVIRYLHKMPVLSTSKSGKVLINRAERVRLALKLNDLVCAAPIESPSLWQAYLTSLRKEAEEQQKHIIDAIQRAEEAQITNNRDSPPNFRVLHREQRDRTKSHEKFVIFKKKN